MKKLVAEIFFVETMDNNKFVRIGEIKVTYDEWKKNRSCCGKKGMIAFAKIKAKKKWNLKDKTIILVHKEYILEEVNAKVWQEISSGNYRPCIHCNTMNYGTSSRCKKCGKHPRRK